MRGVGREDGGTMRVEARYEDDGVGWEGRRG